MDYLFHILTDAPPYKNQAELRLVYDVIVIGRRRSEGSGVFCVTCYSSTSFQVPKARLAEMRAQLIIS